MPKRKVSFSVSVRRYDVDEDRVINSTQGLFGDLFRVVNGDSKHVSFALAYHRVYNLCMWRRGDSLAKNLRFVYEAVACLPENKQAYIVRQIADILMFYDKHLCVKCGRPSVHEMARRACAQRRAWAEATIYRILSHVFFVPGGVFDRNRRVDWVHRAKRLAAV
jgi:hypothetical protein